MGIAFQVVAQIPNSGNNNDQAPRLNFLQSPRDGSSRLFVNDMRGKLYIINGTVLSEYMDLKLLIGNNFLSAGTEQGFVSFAFDPNFKNNGIFYTVHSEVKGSNIPDFSVTKPIINAQGDIILSSHHDVLTQWIAPDPSANSFSGTHQEILRIEQPYADHNLGEIAFNPNALSGSEDYGLLYIAAADGGSDGFPVSNTDPLDNGQDLSVPLGKILRIDPKGNNSINGKYGIPLDNPFVDDNSPNTLGEIWAYGLRNPHRFSWDTGGEGKLLIVDIGQSFIEEVNLGIKGANYGWGNREGTFLINENNEFELFPLPENDQLNNYTYPVAQYDHDSGNAAIAGGFVYRGSEIPELSGKYIFADFSTDGRFFVVDVDNLVSGQQAPLTELGVFNNDGEQTTFLEILGKPRSDLRFGTDDVGEIYVVNKQDGIVRKIVSISTEPGDHSLQTGLDIDDNGQYDALSDGTILTRYLFGGFEGDDLINGAVATNPTRNLNEINAYLQTSIESGYFDIDGNGTVDALSDGIIAMRHLFGGFEGSALIDGAIAPDATRNLAEIQAYLASLTTI